uniref:Uncharacterized protein n=1 Tax=Plectus sambesii TaxID=2011161 RepID=A0A914WY82_9BILA
MALRLISTLALCSLFFLALTADAQQTLPEETEASGETEGSGEAAPAFDEVGSGASSLDLGSGATALTEDAGQLSFAADSGETLNFDEPITQQTGLDIQEGSGEEAIPA